VLLSLVLIFVCGLVFSEIAQKLKLPSLVGMICAGVLLGPYVLDLLTPEILSISGDLRKIALVIIMIRAGLALDTSDLRRVGRPAILMSFVPATLEIAAVTLLAPIFFRVSYLEAAIMGTVLGAVSPAVVVPRMLKMIEHGYGKSKSIPQLILAGASVDDIYVIVLFTSFMGMYSAGSFDMRGLIETPVAIVVGLLAGIVSGLILVPLFKTIQLRDTVKTLVILSFSLLLVALEDVIKAYVPMSGLLSVMALGGTVLKQYDTFARSLSDRLSKIWVAAELMLFVLVGAALDISYAAQAGVFVVALIFAALAIRICGVFVSLLRTKLSKKERLFCAIAYLPKATVQAAIGGLPLAAGVAAGDIILTVAVLAILITAPLGAIGIDSLHKRLLALD